MRCASSPTARADPARLHRPARNATRRVPPGGRASYVPFMDRKNRTGQIVSRMCSLDVGCPVLRSDVGPRMQAFRQFMSSRTVPARLFVKKGGAGDNTGVGQLGKEEGVTPVPRQSSGSPLWGLVIQAGFRSCRRDPTMGVGQLGKEGIRRTPWVSTGCSHDQGL